MQTLVAVIQSPLNRALYLSVSPDLCSAGESCMSYLILYYI